jgi:hypothetical protein
MHITCRKVDMESILTVGIYHCTDARYGEVRRYRYPKLQISAPILRAMGLEPGDRVRVRTLGGRIIVTRLEDTSPSPADAPRARRRRGAAQGRKAEDRMSSRGSPARAKKGGR